MKYVNPPVHTVAVGTAWGEAAMLLASGEKVGGKQLLGAELTDSENHQCFQGNRAALPSASIMIKQPIDAFRGQVQHLLRLSLTQVSSQLTYVSHRQPSLKFSEKRCAIQKSRRCVVLTLHSTKSD